MQLNNRMNDCRSIDELIQDLENYGSEISFQKEFEGKFRFYAVIDNVGVIFYNAVGAIVEPYTLYPLPQISMGTQRKISLATKRIQYWVSNYKEEM